MEQKYIDWFKNHDMVMDRLREMLDEDAPPPPPVTDRKDIPWWPNRMTTAGVTAFPLTVRPYEYITDLCQYLKEKKYNTLSVGAQAWRPGQHKVLPSWPTPIGGPEWKNNLETMLEATACEGMWVQLIPTFGHKDYDSDPDGRELQWHKNHSRKIIEIIKANDYKHVFISVMNEFKHPLTDDDLGDTDIYELGRVFSDSLGLPVSTDHGGREKNQAGERIWKGYWPQAWMGFDYFNWHPTRNPEPSKHQFKKCADRWKGTGKVLLYNETVCYASDKTLNRWPHWKGNFTIACKGRGTEEDRKWAVRDIKNNIKSAGARSRFFFHSIWLGIRGGLDDGPGEFGWVPEY